MEYIVIRTNQGEHTEITRLKDKDEAYHMALQNNATAKYIGIDYYYSVKELEEYEVNVFLDNGFEISRTIGEKTGHEAIQIMDELMMEHYQTSCINNYYTITKLVN